jgi:predicted negative regulator of RcsB-dependent stress response
MSYDLDEQESLENVKAWWAQYGKIITNVISVIFFVAAAYFGYKWWVSYQENQAYKTVMQLNAAIDNNINGAKNEDVIKIARDIYIKYPNSTHSAVGIMRAAHNLSTFKPQEAMDLLKMVANNSKQENYATLASYRLASLLIDNKKPDEAIALMSKPTEEMLWQGLFADRAADAYIAKGDAKKARVLYQQALKITKESQNKALESFIELKMNMHTAAEAS